MKQEFEMLQQEMDDIIAINKNQPPVMKFGDYISGMDTQENVNAYWKVLADKYGFEQMSVEGSAKGNLFFIATPKPPVIKITDQQISDAYQPLFDLLSKEHNVELLNSEMDNVIKACEIVTENIKKLNF